MSGFTIKGVDVSDTTVCPNIMSFCLFMAAVVAQKRGGRNLDYTRECWDFMTEVVGRRLEIGDCLPAEFDWTYASARDCAIEMMEYDYD